MEFAGRTVLITGGLSGIGAATAEAFATEGAEVVVLTLPEPKHRDEIKYFAGPEEAQTLNRHLGSAGSKLHLIEGDAGDPTAVQLAHQQAEELGGVDTLVCNAATNCIHPIIDHDIDLWRRIIEVNLVGPFLAIRACLPSMLKREFGRIISIASTASYVGLPSYSAYCSSKHGLLGLHRSVACEIGGHDITINTVSPGLVDTPSAHLHFASTAKEKNITHDQAVAEALSSSHQSRLVEPKEIADVILFLSGAKARSIHATDIPIRSGWSVA